MSTAAAKIAGEIGTEDARGGMMSQVARAAGHGFESKEKNHNDPHYLWIALAPIFIGHRNRGASFMGDFPDEVLPAKTPIVFDPTRAYAPFELKAISLESTSSAFDRTLPDVDQHPNSYMAENSAYALAKFVEKEYADFGVAVFWDLVGESDEDVNTLFSMIFREEYFANLVKERKNIREVEGVRFEGPFLDQIRTYLNTESGKIVGRVGITKEMRQTVETVLGELKKAVTKAWDFATGKINDTENMIKSQANGKPGKPWYDMPDHRFPSAQPPLDLICLAQTGRSPIDLKQLDASREMSETMGRSVVEGFKEAMKSGGPNTGVSIEDVRKLLEEQETKHREEMAAMEARLGSDAAAETSDSGSKAKE